ncbi:MAG: twin-arginine translocase TatA/TatE family subunit [Prevotella sp.]|nr:twin-arginine translocase TatA/TatE family subunit [Prevotella sp.]
MFGTQELLLIALVILLLFGGKKIPEMMRGLGKGVHSFKEGMKGIDEPQEDNTEKNEKKNDSDKR